MERQQMEQVLVELNAQLSDDNNLDDYHRDRAMALSEHIQAVLNSREDTLSGDQFLLKKLKDSIDEFEINHPQLTTVVGRVSDLLAGAGL